MEFKAGQWWKNRGQVLRRAKRVGQYTKLRNKEKRMQYYVTIPIAGHAFVEVEANSEEEAIEKAMEEVTIKDIESWEPLHQFNQGNVCYCPHPWEVEVEEVESED